MNTTHSRLSMGRLLFEVILIILGVFLGLFVNELRIEQRDRVRAQGALTQIRSELQSNQEQVAKISAHHVTVRDSLNALLSRVSSMENPVTIQDLLKAMPGGFGVAGLQRHSWTLANRLGALEHMDYATASMLSRTYHLQEFYTEKYDRLADNLYLASNIDPSTREGLVLALALLAGDIAIHEEDLTKAYAMAIEHLDEIE